jgi:CheY-like chemotaxis protein
VHVQVDGTGDDKVYLRFRNVGAIPGSMIPDIFDPLKRPAPEHRVPGISGLGLGLFISRQIAAAHGGTILAESDERQDVTMFTVELPRQMADAGDGVLGVPDRPQLVRAASIGVAQPQDAPAGRVLVVDDDADVCQALADALDEEGYAVSTAADGLDALARMREADKPPDVIILDLTMPRMNGAQFRQELLAVPEWSAIPVVLVSADGSLRAVADSLDVAAFLEKPVNLAELLRLLSMLLRITRPVIAR